MAVSTTCLRTLWIVTKIVAQPFCSDSFSCVFGRPCSHSANGSDRVGCFRIGMLARKVSRCQPTNCTTRTAGPGDWFDLITRLPRQLAQLIHKLIWCWSLSFISPSLSFLPVDSFYVANMYSQFWPKGGLPGRLHHYVSDCLIRL